MYDDVLAKCNACLDCQKENIIKKGPSELHSVGFPDRIFAQWGMDLCGPFTKSDDGNSYIAVFTE